MIPVLMSGGSGTRLWPVSRARLPKQFCDLFGEPLQSLTLRRLAPLGDPWIVTGLSLQSLTELNLTSAGVKAGEVLYEPVSRNTAAAIALLCRRLQMKGLGKEVVGVFPSDHLVTQEAEFRQAVKLAESLAKEGKVVTLGIRPDHPETGFGYIQTSEAVLRRDGNLSAQNVMGFHEKPTREKAESFLSQGHFYWNGGIFIFQTEKMAELLAKHEPAVWNPLMDLKDDLSNLSGIYEKIKSISIDYAVMEKIGGTGTLVCVPVDIGWSDVGSWDAVAEENRRRGASSRGGTVRAVDSKNVFVESPAGKIVALIGVEDLNVIDTGDALLITKVGESQRVREIVDPLAKEKNHVVTDHPFQNQSWGRLEVLRDTQEFKSKMITVSARQKMSARASSEGGAHWIVVEGAGEIEMAQKIVSVGSGSHVHLPAGAEYVIRNQGETSMQIVEVQVSPSPDNHRRA